jgi:hypothetical protein
MSAISALCQTLDQVLGPAEHRLPDQPIQIFFRSLELRRSWDQFGKNITCEQRVLPVGIRIQVATL